MFLSSEEIEKHTLRQGDIILDTQILAAINLRGINYQVNAQNDKVGWTTSSAPIFGPAIVLSHSCELDLDNGIKVTSIILSPLRDVNSATSAEKVHELIESNLITDQTTYSYLKYFYIEPHPLLPYINGSVVDFSKCYSVRKQSYNILLDNKAIQLRQEVADSLALKIALYLYRKNKIA